MAEVDLGMAHHSHPPSATKNRHQQHYRFYPTDKSGVSGILYREAWDGQRFWADFSPARPRNKVTLSTRQASKLATNSKQCTVCEAVNFKRTLTEHRKLDHSRRFR